MKMVLLNISETFLLKTLFFFLSQIKNSRGSCLGFALVDSDCQCDEHFRSWHHDPVFVTVTGILQREARDLESKSAELIEHIVK